ncbi:efflux transporter outer membrane subunit [Marinobacterium litorale]|uniref:efflux transporter outer membrane subunit n=1 Tax=Marinobacterium litorale TaxID=404770 RepID=UPI0003FE03B2|nr:efflux transporter outer membrane subunit [Marinobacterium litorale]
MYRTLIPSMRLPGIAALLILLTGCTVLGPDFDAPELETPTSWKQWHSEGQSLQNLEIEAQTEGNAWWLEFDDKTLNALQMRLFAANPDVQLATLNFVRARVQQSIVTGQSLNVDASGAAGRQKLSEFSPSMRMASISAPANKDQLIRALAEPYTLYQAGFDASWEPDLWGRVARQVESSQAQVGFSRAELEGVKQLLSAELARAYFSRQNADRQIRLLEQQIELTEQKLKLIEVRQDAGLDTGLDIEPERSRLRELQAALPIQLSQKTQITNVIALLLGERPGSLSDLLDSAPLLSNKAENMYLLTLGIPSELVNRRPDIMAARSRLHAATAEIGVARADLYPRISLRAGVGFESFEGSAFGEWASRQWQIGPGFYLPIFNQGRLKKRVHLTELKQQQAAIQYRKTVLTAWQEVDDALTNYSAELERYERLKQQEQSLRRQLELIGANRDAGLTDSRAELQARAAVIGMERQLADSVARLKIQRVAVYKSVGLAGA